MNRLRHVIRRLLLALAAATSATAPAADVAPLPALNIDIRETSVSGISSGGFMAVQFQVAHSALVKGAGIVAAGPFYCAQGDVVKATTTCSCTGEPLLSCAVTADSARVPDLVAATRAMADRSQIDDTANLAKQRVVVLAGGKDPLVPPPIGRQLAAFYFALGLPAASLKPIDLADAGHTMPTPAFGNACDVTAEPYLGKCRFDAAKAILEGIYGSLPGVPSRKARGSFREFDQRPYVPDGAFTWSNGLDRSGWVYVPATCARGERCRLHIALHGCKQGQSYLPLRPPPGGGLYYGTTFVKNSGYARWADNNRLVILFPQAVSIPGLNPNGCWDWWGYTDGHYADRQGVQIRALHAMAEGIAAGFRE